jgi:hypothetical protein
VDAHACKPPVAVAGNIDSALFWMVHAGWNGWIMSFSARAIPRFLTARSSVRAWKPNPAAALPSSHGALRCPSPIPQAPLRPRSTDSKIRSPQLRLMRKMQLPHRSSCRRSRTLDNTPASRWQLDDVLDAQDTGRSCCRRTRPFTRHPFMMEPRKPCLPKGPTSQHWCGVLA